MRVKIKDTWYEVSLDNPICIELTTQDKENIANMLDTATKYAVFHDEDTTSSDEKLAWMKT